MEAKYFPHSLFLDVSIGRTPSYTWRSLLFGREALSMGLLWSVGNGNSINIWKDKWIQRPNNFKAIRSGISRNVERVIDFIDWEHGRWDAEKINEVFVPCDTEIILNMKLIDPSHADELVWFHSKDGFFSIRLAYQMLLQKEIAEETEGASSSSNDVELLWNKLWHLNVPRRVRSFIRRGGVTPDDRCEFYGRSETDIHVVMQCHVVAAFWHDSPALLKIRLRVWALVSNYVWNAGNKRIFEGVITPSADMQVRNYRETLMKFQLSPLSSNVVGPVKWRKPRESWVKINSDAALTVGMMGGSWLYC
ncbi:hypothetical protein V2J09_011101 [Rumex salicifolius]